MSETVAKSRRELPGEDDAFAQQGNAGARFDQLHAFNFGRSLGRSEMARDRLWLSLRWLLFGAAVGVVLAAVYLQIFVLNARFVQIAR